jgi:hypothetical protein
LTTRDNGKVSVRLFHIAEIAGKEVDLPSPQPMDRGPLVPRANGPPAKKAKGFPVQWTMSRNRKNDVSACATADCRQNRSDALHRHRST